MTCRAVCSAALVLLVATNLSAQTASPTRAPLRVVSAGPSGEVAALEEANEVRVVFSESMVPLGRVPPKLGPPFFHISPSVEGTFRWSGTTILIFTPARKLPLATKYDVRIDASAAAESGRRLDSPYTFSFTTPTARLLQTHWYRPDGRYDKPPVIVLRFNQPVKPEDVAAHVSAAFQEHPFEAPVFSQAAMARLRATDPASLQAFEAKLAAARAAASATSTVPLVLAAEWDKKKFPPARDMVVLAVTSAVPPDSWVRVTVDGRVPSLAGPAVSTKPQDYTLKVLQTFFVNGFDCRASCDPEESNPIGLRVPVKAEAFAAATTAVDVTDSRQERPVVKSAPKKRETWQLDESSGLSLEDAGFKTQPPASTWIASIAPTLTATDGQTLGYTWLEWVENWHQRAFTSFGDGHGVWEAGGGSQLPFYSRNFLNVRQWAAPVEPGQLMRTIVDLRKSNFHDAPDVDPIDRRLGVSADKIQSHGLDLSKALKPSGTGLVWAAVEEGKPIEHASVWRNRSEPIVRSTIVQVTNLGISIKDSALNTLIFVTRLDTAVPVPGAHVSIVQSDGETKWSGITGPDGVVIAPDTRLRDPRRWWEFAFIVTAEKDGDFAYTASDWNEGVTPWEFALPFSLDEAEPLLRGTVFSDRGVYRLGEEVHFKAVLRHNTPDGIRLLASGTEVYLTVRDSRNRLVDERTVKVNAWSSGEWTFTLPANGALGNYAVRAVLASDRPKPGAKAGSDAGGAEEELDQNEDGVPWNKTVRGSFLVAAYRKPDFRVDVTLTGTTMLAGDPLQGVVTGRYLFGAPMPKRPTHWTFTRTPVSSAPDAIVTKYPADRWTFVGWPASDRRARTDMASDDGQLAATGQLPLSLGTDAKAGIPYSYTLEGDVEDVSRQHIANRISAVVHPAPWYIGVRQIPYFNQQKAGTRTELVAVGLDGAAVAGIPIDVTLTQIQWLSVRHAAGNGFFSWDTKRKEVPSGEWHLTSAADPVPLDIPLPAGGLFILEAKAKADRERFAVTTTQFYVLGEGYTAWERFDHNRINLVAERTTYKPGETARIMIQSPWEQATGLVTTEREGIRTHREFALTSTQQSIEIPVTEGDIPNLFVSVLLVKGRSKPAGDSAKQEDPADPGKPSFRLGYVQLTVEDSSKRLTVAVSANKEEYRPANAAKVTVDVKDKQGRASASEVTLWAVDYGVLSLTGYRTPDVLKSVYVNKSLGVLSEDTRQRIVSRRVLTPKGASDGGGGGDDSGPGMVRRDFRTLAFWLGSVATDANGHASVDVKLPESLTTYRIMAIAADRGSRFGSADTEFRINKPVTLKATFPRFLAVGDKASFGAVVTSQLKAGGPATVTIASLDPDVMQFADTAPQTVDVPAGGSVEVRFDAAGRAIGRARVRMTVKLAGEEDAFEDIVPIEVLVSPETVSAIGQADDSKPLAAERVSLPEGVVTTFGGLRVELASTALVGLGEGARYLVEYPYGCAEQRGSRALAMLLTADLGDAFRLPGIEPDHLRATVQSALQDLERYQCGNGGFAYWPGECWSTSPYLTAYLLHVFKVASDLKYDVNTSMRDRAYRYLEKELAEPPPTNESWWPSYTAWQAFAVKVLVEGGRNQDSNITRLYGYRERMPVFGLAYLHDALVANGETRGPRADDLRRRMTNAILPEAASAHVEELSDPYLLWFWNSNVRSTAIVLSSMIKADQADMPYAQIVRWMLQARDKGRWGNTQENALALEALVGYYRRFESAPPDFSAVVSLASQPVVREQFRGRTTDTRSTDIPMSKLLASASPGAPPQPLTFTRTGQGTLFYSARLRYAADRLFQQGLDQGIRIERSYAPYVETGTKPAATAFKAGDLVRVTLTLQLTKERRFVAVTDPLPAGFEAVESWFATSATALSMQQDLQGEVSGNWFTWWQRGGFDHVERHDDRIELFATRLSEGRHQFSYVVRATTAGTFRTAPAHGEEMYEPEVFGRTPTAVIEVRK